MVTKSRSVRRRGLRASELAVTAEDAGGRRRQLYSLSPNVTVRTIEGGQEIDFGCAVLRERHR